MKRTTTRLSVMLLAAGCVMLASCSDDAGDETTTPATTNTTAATSEPVPTTEAPDDRSETTTATPELSAEEQDQADVEATLQAFNAVLARATTGEESIEGIYPFSRDTAREQWVTQVMAYQAQEITISGLTELEVLEVSVDGDSAEAVACADVSAVEAVDGEGESIIAEGRLDRSLQDFVLERDDSAEFGWYIVEDTNRNEPCDG